MTKREQIVHLLNRFGLGANEPEIQFYSRVGVDETIRRLVNFESTPENYPVNLTELYFTRDDKVALDPSRVTMWWLLKMVCTNRPLEDKLTLFWHNHFAVSGSKAEFGPMMQGYLRTIREGVYKPFPELLEQISYTPAMVHWLDIDASQIDHPNENFAREVMELFTLGIGNYTEADIKKAASAFVGINLRYPYYESKVKDGVPRLKHFVERNIPLIATSVTAELQDNSVREILGKSAAYGPSTVLNMLGTHEHTDKRTMSKLWSFVAGTQANDALVSKLVDVYVKGDRSLKPVMLEIAHMPEFWDKDVVGTMVKSPIDFTIGAYRQMEAGPQILANRKASATHETPMNDKVERDMYGLFYLTREQGLLPLYPPDVSGWKFGPGWVTTSTLPFRAKTADFLFNPYQKGGATATYFLDVLVRDYQKETPEALAQRFCDTYGVRYGDQQMKVLVGLVKKLGGPEKLKDRKSAAQMAAGVTKAIFWSPEYQLC